MKHLLTASVIMLFATACAPKLNLVLKEPSAPTAKVKLAPLYERELPKIQTTEPSVILVNQVGYLPSYEKIAIYRSEASQPVAWELIDANANILASGRTVVSGYDAAADETVHMIDFSTFTTPVETARLTVAGMYSHPFAVKDGLYTKMKYDALAFFYHQRSGVAIKMPFAGREDLTRPAGHPGDAAVSCLSKDANVFGTGEGMISPKYSCNYAMNLLGGWYDAGDHGKYTVNGANAVWIMLNQYERALQLGQNAEAFKDGTLSIPENANGVPDILDEVRFELAFLLKMQTQKGGRLAGMLHHKIHDDHWTGIPLAPHAADVPRHVYPVSTTATFSGAAVFAMGARVFRPYDAAFSEKMEKAAVVAWKAAQRNPKVYAASDAGHGGGPYSDPRAEDEKYWAAAELYITTRDEMYLSELTASPFWADVPAFLKYDETDGVFTWKDVWPLGNLSLAVTKDALPAEKYEEIRSAVIAAANQFDNKMNTTGYQLPLTTEPKGTYPWGSNSNVVNNLIVLGLAYDLTKDRSYIDAVVTGMGYLLGRNPMDTSYVTGYGIQSVQNPHHRFFAKQADSSFPAPPPGVFSGGPNSGIQDDHVKERLSGCAPAKCYKDHVDSWSTNEIAINWNAAFAWVAAFLDDVSQQ